MVRFDVDQLVDYRSRRPPLRFETDHWEHYAAPELDIVALTDTASTGYLLLTGPEPDTQWERFAAALEELVRTLGVRLVVNLTGIPMAVPHTRPDRGDGARHAARADRGPRGAVRHRARCRAVPWRSSSTGSARPGTRRWGSPCTCRTTWRARSTRRPLACWSTTSRWPTGLYLPTDALTTAAERAEREIAEQVAGSEEVAQVVAALEQQYDTVISDAAERPGSDERASCPARTSWRRRSSGSWPGTTARTATPTVAHDPTR